MKIKRAKNIWNNRLFLAIILFSFLKPSGFSLLGFSTINTFINVVRILGTGYIIGTYFLKNCKISRFLLIEAVYFAVWLLCYLINGAPSKSIIHVAIFAFSMISLTLLTEHCVKCGFTNHLLDAYFINYSLLLIGNFLYIIVNSGWRVGIENGLYETFSFLNSDNGTASYIFAPLYLCLLQMDLTEGKAHKEAICKLIVILSVSILTQIRMWSATAILGIVLFVLYMLFARKNKLVTGKVLLFVALLLNIGVTFFRIQEYFSFIIEDVLGKSVHLTGRTTIWDWGITAFLSHPLFGNGPDGGDLLYVDNSLIQLLYRGGIALTMTFLVFTLYPLVKNRTFRTEKLYSRDTYAMLAIITVMSIAESWNSFMGFYIIMIMAENADRIIFQKKLGIPLRSDVHD